MKFMEPEGRTVSVLASRAGRASDGIRVAAGQVVEVAVRLATIGAVAGAGVSFVVAVTDPSGQEIERHPAHRPIETTVPDARFEAIHWTA